MLNYFRLVTLALILTGVASCKKNSTTSTPPLLFAGTLGGSPGSCTPAIFAGTYTKGVALTASNTITVQANVSDVGLAGVYTVITNTVNGVSVFGTGTLSGVQNVF